MQITIDLPQDLEQDLLHQSAKFNVPLQTLILQALRQMIQVSTSRWSEVILSYEGISDFPPFESYRDKLLPPLDPDLQTENWRS